MTGFMLRTIEGQWSGIALFLNIIGVMCVSMAVINLFMKKSKQQE
jgi:hypothetical protein